MFLPIFSIFFPKRRSFLPRDHGLGGFWLLLGGLEPSTGKETMDMSVVYGKFCGKPLYLMDKTTPMNMWFVAFYISISNTSNTVPHDFFIPKSWKKKKNVTFTRILGGNHKNMPNTNCDMRRVQRRKSRKAAYFQISPPKISLKPLQNTKIPCLYLGSSSSSWWKLQFWALYLPYWASSKPDPSRALKMMVFGPRTPTPSVQVISGLKSWWNQERIHVAMTTFAQQRMV